MPQGHPGFPQHASLQDQVYPGLQAEATLLDDPGPWLVPNQGQVSTDSAPGLATQHRSGDATGAGCCFTLLFAAQFVRSNRNGPNRGLVGDRQLSGYTCFFLDPALGTTAGFSSEGLSLRVRETPLDCGPGFGITRRLPSIGPCRVRLHGVRGLPPEARADGIGCHT